jgi:hypothetical protein
MDSSTFIAIRHLTEKKIKASSIKRCAHFIMWHFLKSFFFTFMHPFFRGMCVHGYENREGMQNKEKFEMGERVIHTFLSLSLYFFLSLFLSLSLSLFLRECGGGKSSVRRPSRFTGRSGCGCDLNFYLLPPLLLLSVCQSICLSVYLSLASFSISALTK